MSLSDEAGRLFKGVFHQKAEIYSTFFSTVTAPNWYNHDGMSPKRQRIPTQAVCVVEFWATSHGPGHACCVKFVNMSFLRQIGPPGLDHNGSMEQRVFTLLVVFRSAKNCFPLSNSRIVGWIKNTTL